MATSNSLPNAATITLPELQSTLALYDSVLMHLVMLDVKKKQKTGGVLGELLYLDQKRYEELPEVPDRTSMTKKDLTWAMDWKLCARLTTFSQNRKLANRKNSSVSTESIAPRYLGSSRRTPKKS